MSVAVRSLSFDRIKDSKIQFKIPKLLTIKVYLQGHHHFVQHQLHQQTQEVTAGTPKL